MQASHLPSRRSSTARRKSFVNRPLWHWVSALLIICVAIVLLGFAFRGTNSNIPYSGLVESINFKHQAEFEGIVRTYDGTGSFNSSKTVPAPKSPTAVVMRTYGPPTLFKREFLLNLTSQLQAHIPSSNSSKSSPYDIWILHDASPKPPARGPISRLKAQIVRCIEYVFGAGAVASDDREAKLLAEAQLWDDFAADNGIGIVHYNLIDILTRFNRTRHLSDNANILAWALHEPTLVFFEEALLTKGTRKYEHIWFIEDDIFFTGNLATFFNFYGRNPADLITALLEPSDVWWNTWAGPLSSLPTIDWRNVWYSHEHVVRISPRLLQTLRELHELNVVLYGEAYAPTVCKAMKSWCQVHSITRDPFYNEHLYTVHGFSDEQITPELYDLLWTRPELANKWVHGMKRNDPRKCEPGIMCA